ncbi:CarD family transcriptional regulator [Treponema endosymbiont of Eucomonympha sp.]|uniref:CarD family transcriptional regulator n=1 Tax=Treponema endosymbiont of Eucomonympha sp. TaxID=1580831 RepID=UPI000AB8D8ED|nr:CarD family transcriptional regulator [Treponema endosymbiont of Eucomonympha sp.]
MKEETLAFALGQRVVYPSQGVGKIFRIADRQFEGKTLTYYDIYFEEEDMNIMVPAERAEELGVRCIVPPDEAQQALDMMSEDCEPITSDWKLRYQTNYDLLRKGSVADVATIVRCLYHRSKVKELPLLERKLYESAKSVMSDEIGCALDIPPKEVEKMIHARLEPWRALPREKTDAPVQVFTAEDFPGEPEAKLENGVEEDASFFDVPIPRAAFRREPETDAEEDISFFDDTDRDDADTDIEDIDDDE